MKKKTINFLSIILTVALGIGALMTVPAVYAETKTGVASPTVVASCPAIKTIGVSKLVTVKPPVLAKRVLTATDKANLVTLKTLYKQIVEEVKQIRAKAKADKAAGKDLTTFTAALKTAQKTVAQRVVSRGVMLTEAERTTLATLQTAIRTLEQQFKLQKKAGATATILAGIKVQLKTAKAARTTELKAIRTAALTDYSGRLVTLISDANVKLTFLQGLFAKLP